MDLFNLKDQIKKNEFSIMKTPDQPKKNLMILVEKGKDKKKAENSSNKVKKNKIFLSVLLSIFWRIWAKLLHSVQKRYTPSPARGVQNWVTVVAPSLQCLRSKTCQALRVVSVVKINRLILLNLTAFPKQWSPYQMTCLLKISRKTSNFFLKWSDYRVTYSS